ncbi:MAG: hydrogenase [Lentisphaeria bacterium]|nr:hydrogenase [Lentisphaeria bacterium]
MFNILKARLVQGYRTGKFPHQPPVLPERFLGRPVIDGSKCSAEISSQLSEMCPADAISGSGNDLQLDLGKCIFCGKCQEISCGGITFSKEHAVAALTRENLICNTANSRNYTPEEQVRCAITRLCGKSLKIREVSAGGCAACELDFNVLNTLAWDMGRFGIQVVASPRHADCILVTGPVSENMALALQKSFDAVPDPAFVIACGACAISGGIYAESPETRGGVCGMFKPDLYIPGCPPHPTMILEGLLRLMGKRFLQKKA